MRRVPILVTASSGFRRAGAAPDAASLHSRHGEPWILSRRVFSFDHAASGSGRGEAPTLNPASRGGGTGSRSSASRGAAASTARRRPSARRGAQTGAPVRKSETRRAETRTRPDENEDSPHRYDDSP